MNYKLVENKVRTGARYRAEGSYRVWGRGWASVRGRDWASVRVWRRVRRKAWVWSGVGYHASASEVSNEL